MIKNIGVILASGVGNRYGSIIPKQFVKLNGKPVICYVLDEFINSKQFDLIVVVMNDLKYTRIIKEYNDPHIRVIKGGDCRHYSVYNVLKYCNRFNPENILIHEAVRPLIQKTDLVNYINLLSKYDAVVTTETISDALLGGNRDDFKLVQAPEAFKFRILYNDFDVIKKTTAIYEQLKERSIYFNTLNHPNYKITYQYDLFTLEHLIKYNKYESHTSLLDGRTVMLLGRSGGIGSEVYKSILNSYAKKVFIPTSKELDTSSMFLNTEMLLKYNDVDLFINCAGIAEKDEHPIYLNYDRIMNINFKANLLLVEFAKNLRNWHNRQINIVLISSSSATKGRPGTTIYSASKSSLHSLVESQSKELSKQNIFINCICPEKVMTDMLRRLGDKSDPSEVLSTKETAKAILSYCETKESGQIIHIRKGMKI